MKYILAIDQGTTGSKVSVFNKRGRKVASAYKEFPQHFPKPGWVEHDPEDIWKSVYESLQKVLKELPRGSVEAIGITNQRETTVVWDTGTGKPVYNAIVWQCRRTSPRCEALKKKGFSGLFKKRTGLPVDAYFSATKIEWILKNVSGARKKAKAGKLCFGTTDSWILWKLTGGKVHATDHTNASRTMLYNIDKLEWDKTILMKLGIPADILPEVKRSSGIFGYTERTGKLPPGIPVSGIAGDQQAALFGQTCFTPGTMKNTYGTGCFVLMNTGDKRSISRHGLIETLGCGPEGEPAYVLEGAIFIAGAAIQWLRDGLKIIPNSGHSEIFANKTEDNHGVYFVPAFVGLGAPYWEPEARGIITGLTRGTTREHIARAALEAMAYQTKDVLIAMQKDSGLKIKELKIDGGAVVNNFLCQHQADILGLDVIRPKEVELTSLGAAYLAGLAVGYWKGADKIKELWAKDKVFSPKISKKESQSLYKGWTKAVKQALAGL